MAYTISIEPAATSNLLDFGDAGGAASHIVCQSFTTIGAGNITGASNMLIKRQNGAPGDDIVVSILSFNGGTPVGASSLGTFTITNPTTANCSGATSSGTFASPIFVTATTQYWLTVQRSGSPSGVNYWGTCGDAGGNSYAGGGAGYIDNSGSFTDLTGAGFDFRVDIAVADAGPAGVKTWDGLAIASVKTINGLATGSIKTVNNIS